MLHAQRRPLLSCDRKQRHAPDCCSGLYGRFCHASSAMCGSSGAISGSMPSSSADSTVWQARRSGEPGPEMYCSNQGSGPRRRFLKAAPGQHPLRPASQRACMPVHPVHVSAEYAAPPQASRLDRHAHQTVLGHVQVEVGQVQHREALQRLVHSAEREPRWEGGGEGVRGRVGGG